MGFSGHDLADLDQWSDVDDEDEPLVEIFNGSFPLVAGFFAILICILFSCMMFIVGLLTQAEGFVMQILTAIVTLPYWAWCLVPIAGTGLVGIFIWLIKLALKTRQAE